VNTLILVWLAVVTVGLLALLAMVAELAGRLSNSTPSLAGVAQVVPLDGFTSRRLEINSLGLDLKKPQQILIVLSTSCDSCRSIVGNPADVREFISRYDAEMVVVGPSESSIREFMIDARYGYRCDPLGQFSRESLGIDSSPTLVLLEGEFVKNAFSFASLEVAADFLSPSVKSS
jgi:hypothetical protein